jgi:parallel beta-helix repeat protein
MDGLGGIPSGEVFGMTIDITGTVTATHAITGSVKVLALTGEVELSAQVYSTYYVDATGGLDTNSGAATTEAWKTIAKVNASTFLPGNSILFKCGETWAETLTVPSAGTAGKPITFGAYSTGAKPIITGSSARDYCIQETAGRGYITIDGLEFQAALEFGVGNNYWTVGGVERSTPNWIIQNCTFTNCGARLFGPNGIVQHNTFTGLQPTAASGGAIHIRGLVAANCLAHGNVISEYYGRGIWFMNGASNCTATGNTVSSIYFNYGTSGEGYGINFDGYGQPLTGVMTATDNTVYNCDSNGIELENCSGGSVLTANLIHDCDRSGILYMNYPALGVVYEEQRGKDIDAVATNNIIYRCRYGVEVRDVGEVNLWHNTFYEAIGSYPKTVYVADAAAYVQHIDFRNNVVLLDWNFVVSVPHSAEGWAHDFDAFDNNAQVDATIEEVSNHWYTLAQVKVQGWATNSFTTDPAFVDPTAYNFTLQAGSPCKLAGATGLGVLTDYTGAVRGSPPSIGAYE